MSKKYIGDVIDIHAGGEDLIFPHHENEIAQSEAANDKEFARYWMHNGFLKINNEKMSKSLGNFFTVREIGEKYDLQVIRFFMLSAHYRSPLNFSEELVEASKNGLDRIRTAAKKLEEAQKAGAAEISEEEKLSLSELADYKEKFDKAMDDDLNTADAISVIFELVKYINTRTTVGKSSSEYAKAMLEELTMLCDVLGIILTEEEHLLTEKGIILEDTREGVRWKRA